MRGVFSGLRALDPLLRDPGAAERGTLFHAILHRFAASGTDPRGPAALDVLLAKGKECFAENALPPDVEAVWWPRFQLLADEIVAWERERAENVTRRAAEARAASTTVGELGGHAVGLCRPRRHLAGRPGRHPRLQDRLVAVQGPGAHAACAAARAGRRAAEARRVQGCGTARSGRPRLHPAEGEWRSVARVRSSSTIAS